MKPGFLAMIYCALGNNDSAFIWLERAYEQGDFELTGTKASWNFSTRYAVIRVLNPS